MLGKGQLLVKEPIHAKPWKSGLLEAANRLLNCFENLGGLKRERF